jgi:hypothetical protein
MGVIVRSLIVAVALTFVLTLSQILSMTTLLHEYGSTDTASKQLSREDVVEYLRSHGRTISGLEYVRGNVLSFHFWRYQFGSLVIKFFVIFLGCLWIVSWEGRMPL